ncbi:MAG: DUF664 domain-containing protein [Dehalococcoidia bacterium]
MDYVRTSFELQGKDLLANVQDLSAEELAFRPAPHANSIGFLWWHVARVEDGWFQRSIQRQTHLWVSAGWARRFAMPEEMRDMGYNYSLEQLEAFKTPSRELLLEYWQAVRDATMAFLGTWDPDGDAMEVRAPWGGTMRVQDVCVQVLWELNQHGGQIAYLRGLQRGLQRPEYMGPMAPSSS